MNQLNRLGRVVAALTIGYMFTLVLGCTAIGYEAGSLLDTCDAIDERITNVPS